MALNSTEAGYLVPVSEPSYDAAFTDTLQSMLVGVTGIPGDLVRPRWQPNPPQQPDFSTDWIAFGALSIEPLEFSYEEHVPTAELGVGQSTITFDENVQVLHSIYGPNATRTARRLIAGLQIAQNRYTLRTFGIVIGAIGTVNVVPALLKETWVPKVDLSIEYRRRASHNYAIRTIAELPESSLDNELWVTPLIIQPPA